MTGVIRKATVFVALGLVAASAAMAGIPSAANCTVPAFIKVVGTKVGVPDPRGTFSITVRDIGNFPVVGSNVVLNFAACTDTRLCSGTNVTCAAPARVTGITNGSGVVTFTVVGGGLHPGGVFAGAAAGCVTILADSYVIGNATANVYDLNGALGGAKNGVAVTDMPLFLADWAGSATYRGRSDFNQNGAIAITDLPIWLQCWGSGNSVTGCTTTYCP